MVDDWRYDELNQYRWFLASTGYAARKEVGRTILMHVVVVGYKSPDHIDGNPFNNQEYNLRPATNSQNQMNVRKRKVSTSIYKGVHWNKEAGKWQAGIMLDGKKIHLGLFTLEIEAAKAYDAKAKELFGDRARLNFS